MKLALINYEYPPLGGGAGNATACIARALVDQGHNVLVVTSAFREMRGTVQEQSGLRIARLAVRRHCKERSNHLEKLSFVIAAARALPSLLRDEGAEGLIVFFSLPCGPLGWLMRQHLGLPYVISLRGGDVPGAEASVGMLHRILAPLRRRVLRNALAVVANSPGLGRLSERSDPVPVVFIPNGVDTEFFKPSCSPPKPAEGMRLLFAGRFQPQKNLFVLLDCFAKMVRASAKPLRLVLIGDGPQREDLQAHADQLGIADYLEWPGWLDKTAMREAYRQADVFLNPSLYEGMPNTVLEAMACGMPVIASRVMGNEDLVVNEKTGLLFDLSDPGGLVNAMLALSGDPEERGRMGVCAREIVCARYTWSAAAAQYAVLFEQV